MKYLFCLLFFISTIVEGSPAVDSTYTLLISTWPSHAEIYVGERPSDFVNPAPSTTPLKLKLPLDSTLVRITLYKPDYADTTLDVQVKSPRDSYLMFMLQPETDASILEKQQEILDARNRHQWGRKIIWGSTLPFALSGIFALIAQHQFNDAETYADRIENSTIKTGNHFDELVENHTDKKKLGKDFRTYALTSLCIGSAFLVTGLILSF
jgi:hypothetical protein